MHTARRIYTIQPVPAGARGEMSTGPAWEALPTLEVDCFRPEGSRHRPRTRLKLGYTPQGLWGLFRVADRYVRCVHTGFQAHVFKDSCVECFLQPQDRAGYFNFEFNCGGSLRVAYITDPTRVGEGFKAFTRFTPAQGAQVRVKASLPVRVEPEIQEPVDWQLSFFIPFTTLASYAGPLDVRPGVRWRGNFFKCADESSHPHWASWAPLNALNFHAPDCFGTLQFGGLGNRTGVKALRSERR